MVRQAIGMRLVLTFDYDGFERVVEPHVLGLRGGRLQVEGYQVAGGTRSGRLPGWRRFEAARMRAVRLGLVQFPVRKASPPSSFDKVLVTLRP